MEHYLEALHDSTVGTAIREGAVAFPWIETFHVLAITTVLGTIMIVDLRLVGYRSHRRGARQLIKDLLPFTWVAFAVAVITGTLLFTSNPVNYFANTAFRAKMVLMVLAGLNMGVFHLTAHRRIVEWDDQLPTPVGARVAGISSLLLWIAVVFCGRWIGFTV